MKPEDEYSWLNLHEKPRSPSMMRAVWGAIIASGIASTIIIAMAINWIVERML